MSGLMSVLHWLERYSIVFMFAVFGLLLITLYWPGRRGRFDRDAQIPLEDDR